MKTKLTISVVLLFLTIAFISKLPTAEEKSISYTQIQQGTSIPDNEFMIGALHNAYDIYYDYTNINDYYHMNTWHKYTGPFWGWYLLPPAPHNSIDPHDDWNGISDSIEKNVKPTIEGNNIEGFRTIMDRPIIQYLTYGQRSDYQCEENNIDPSYWFYSYKNHSNINMTDSLDNSIYGSGQWVRYCGFDPQNPGGGAGYVVSGLKANHEQSNKKFNPWTSDSLYAWYIKPRIRVDPDFVDSNPNDTICRIEILDWHGSTVKNVGILGRHFIFNNNYDGSYLMEFDFKPWDSNLVVNPGWLLCPYPDSGRIFHDWGPTHPIKTDFRVYWYGTCEMWIDYVRVENLPSVQLHSGELDSTINREVRWALIEYNANKPNNFYIDEFEFNITSSIGRVDSLIKAYSGNKLALMPALNLDLYKVHIPNCWDSVTLDENRIKRDLIEPTGISYVCYFPYPFYGEWSGRISYHPNTLYSGGYYKEQGILSHNTTPTGYDNWLQDRLDKGTGGGDQYIEELKLHDNLTKLSSVNLKPINVPQAHLWWDTNGVRLKEPSNQEAEMMSDLAISYGAKGILYFAYNGEREFSNDTFYMRGLMNPKIPGPGYELRTTNVYGQNKAQKYSEMNQKYAKWGPYLMSFDDENRHSYIYRDDDERNALLNNTYFLTARTFYPGSGTPTCSPVDSIGINPLPDSEQSLTYDCPEKTYLQIALFDNDVADYDKYFMIINRRCSPFIDSTSNDNNGGRRIIKVRFDAGDSAFAGYNNWKIINLEDSSTVVTFNKNFSSLLNLNYFMPGEGKLYKITPAKL